MYNIEINSRINQIVKIFHRIGLWQSEEDSSVFLKTAQKLKYIIFQVAFLISFLTGGILSDSKSESVYLITTSITLLVIIIKLFYILWSKEETLAFIRDIGTHSVEDYEEFVKVNEKVKKLIKFSSSTILVLCVSAGVLFILPVFSSKKRLPYNIWIPLDWENNAIAYVLAYAYIVIGVIINIIEISFNIIIWYLMMNCAIKYQILGNQLRNIFVSISPIKTKISKYEAENSFLQELIYLIKTHRNSKKTIDRFKSCFGNLFFAQITTSGIGICGSVYVLAFDSHNVTLFEYTIYFALLFHNFFDIFIVMYLGNEIKLWSDRLSYCLFESNWLERSNTSKRCAIVLTEVLKQPQELLIGKLYPLNMETFISIVKFAYSMFNILKNVN